MNFFFHFCMGFFITDIQYELFWPLSHPLLTHEISVILSVQKAPEALYEWPLKSFENKFHSAFHLRFLDEFQMSNLLIYSNNLKYDCPSWDLLPSKLSYCNEFSQVFLKKSFELKPQPWNGKTRVNYHSFKRQQKVFT